MVKKLSFPKSASPPVWGYSERRDGNMSLCYGDVSHALAHRIDFLKKLDIDYRDVVCAKQVHGSRLAYVAKEDKGKGALSFQTALEATDGLITDAAGVPLAVFSADCAVAFLYDPVRPAVGIVHAGWRGTKEKIIVRALALMKDTFNTRVSKVYAAFGPAIRQCCYEVGEEFRDYFPHQVQEKKGRNHFDLVAENRQQLLDQGVTSGSIIDAGVCTACENKQFYSHRKESQGCGRMMSVIMLREGAT